MKATLTFVSLIMGSSAFAAGLNVSYLDAFLFYGSIIGLIILAFYTPKFIRYMKRSLKNKESVSEKRPAETDQK